jgi:hypothetical protein
MPTNPLFDTSPFISLNWRNDGPPGLYRTPLVLYTQQLNP